MKIRFLNPVEQVTGSCYWLRDDERGVEFLVDCGMVQGEVGENEWNTRKFEFDPAKLACVFLTHTHLDHCGLLPRLAKEGFAGPIWCTRESGELAKVSLADAARQPGTPFNRADVDRLKFREPSGQLFGKLHSFGTDLYFGFYRSAHIVGSVAIQIVWGAKPVSGSANTQRQITFSGDLGCNVEGAEHQPLLRHRMRPPPASFAVVESTYGGALRPADEHDFHARVGRLKAAIDRTLFEHKGVALIPCYAIDRTQAVLFDLHYIFRSDPERYQDVPVFLHAPTAAQVNGIYAEALRRKEPTKANVLKSMWRNKRLAEWLGIDATPEGEAQVEGYLGKILSSPKGNGLFRMDPLTGQTVRRERPNPDVIYTTISEPPRRLLDGREPFAPSIFVTGGGMCNGGPVLSYLGTLLRRESTALILTGYLPPSTIGGKLLQHAKLPPEERRRSSDWIELPSGRVPLSEVVASAQKVAGYSGHADQQGLIDWLFSEFNGKLNLAGQTIFITHGDEDQRRALQAAIEARSAEWAGLYPDRHHGVVVHLPKKRDRDRWFDLDGSAWHAEDVEPPPRLVERVDALEQRLAAVEELLRQILSKQ